MNDPGRFHDHFQERFMVVRNVGRLGKFEPERSTALKWIKESVHAPLTFEYDEIVNKSLRKLEK